MWGGKGNYEKTGAYKGMVVTHLFQVSPSPSARLPGGGLNGVCAIHGHFSWIAIRLGR